MQQPVVWLVEDEISIADTLIYMLQQEGFAVKAFERGLPVLEEARRQVPRWPFWTSGCRISAALSCVASCWRASVAAGAVSDGAQ
jgi:CheY-like chemotaxis protein